ncbi:MULTISPECIES: succinylglutamate desuccinylase [unclassified Serratia (in: enterobacteria)]|uniref:succinylglutamate desuccinylase n=1 Tax=unclassified Serratia (in: enterobacteria) TaxID=2647522 RepID=UPI00050798C8|nr:MULTISPECIES: succinylglutamate desuccinylase [unclassified Serratia (in: enterobacteria)]KFK94286.1 succinylglutamate desuccinylase [Serratia sp. Ag1]KFK95900.1 succinylglutamate desuccinylase [Serratia sp. Ag2]
MIDLLALTLAGEEPAQQGGENDLLRWQWLGEGILEICPRHGYQRAVAISAGIHGNETAPIELLNQCVAQVLAGTRPLAVRLLVVLGNPPAMRAGKRYLSSDMNRMFGGRYVKFEPGQETARAQQLEQVIGAFFAGENATRFHFDLHTAIRESHLPRFGLLPFQNRAYSAEMLALLDAAALDALVIHQAPGGTFSHFSSEQWQAASCTLELGKARPFGHNDLQQFVGIYQALQSAISAEPLPQREQAPIRVFRVEQSLIKHSEAFKLYLSDDTANFTELPRGTVLCDQPGETYRVQHDKEWILFPNPNVALGLRAGMLLIEVPRSTLF